jgi:hypothetical protein
MAEIIHKLTVENSRLNDIIDQLNDVKSPGPLRSRSANPSNASITPTRKSSSHLGGQLVDEDENYSVSASRKNLARVS